MIRFYSKKEHPLRVYIEGPDQEVQSLISSLSAKYYEETQYSRAEDLRNIVFYDDNDLPYFPAGILQIVSSMKPAYQFKDDTNIVTDVDNVSIPEDFLDGITLRDYQLLGIVSALNNKRGLVQVPTGGGKTEMMAGVVKYISSHKEGNILICVPTINLLTQTYLRLVDRGIPERDLCMYGDQYSIDISRRVVVATVQTVFRRLQDKEFKKWYEGLICLVMDECHHSACRTWYSIIDTLQPEYNLGFSAEPFYGDKAHLIRDLILRGVTGPIIYRVPISYLIARGYLSKPYMIAIDTYYNGSIFGIIDWKTVNKNGLVLNAVRNSIIIESAKELIESGKNPLILVNQISHGVTLAQGISKFGYEVAMMTGGSKVTRYVDGTDIESYKDSEGEVKRKFQEGIIQVLIGTSIMDEGIDMPAISAVILAGGGASVLKLVQRIGRGLRPRKEDNTTIILDFKDGFNVITRKHFNSRKEAVDKMDILCYYIKDPSELRGLVRFLKETRP